MDFINQHADKALKPMGNTKLAEAYVDGSGRTRVKGTKALKGSQAYPLARSGGIKVNAKTLPNVICNPKHCPLHSLRSKVRKSSCPGAHGVLPEAP